MTVQSFIIYERVQEEYNGRTTHRDNCKDVVDFIEAAGGAYDCTLCNGSGEYESDYGPRGCDPCNSRLIAFKRHDGLIAYADFGDTIELHADGLHLVESMVSESCSGCNLIFFGRKSTTEDRAFEHRRVTGHKR